MGVAQEVINWQSSSCALVTTSLSILAGSLDTSIIFSS